MSTPLIGTILRGLVRVDMVKLYEKERIVLRVFSFINHENKFSLIFDFVFFGTVSKTGQKLWIALLKRQT